MEEVLNSRNVILNEIQRIKFKQACERSLNDHQTYGEALTAANIYLNYIIDFPDLTL